MYYFIIFICFIFTSFSNSYILLAFSFQYIFKNSDSQILLGTCSQVSTAIRCLSSALPSLVPVLKPTEDTVIFIFNTHTHPQVNNHTPFHQPNEPASVNSGPSPAHSAHRWPRAASQGKCDRIVPKLLRSFLVLFTHNKTPLTRV